MEHCSEQDDVRARERGDDDDDDDDEDEDEEENLRVTKRAHLDVRKGATATSFEDDEDVDPDLSMRPSTASSPKTSVAGSPRRDLLKTTKKSARAKAPSPRRTVRPSSAQIATDESSEQ